MLLPYGSQGAVGLLQPVRAVQPPSARCWRVVAQGCVVVEAVGGVDAEPGHAAREPEPHDIPELLMDGRFPPVQIGHAGQETVQVVLAAGLIKGPGRLPGGIQPVVRRAATRRGVGPYVERAVRRAWPAGRVGKPGVGAAGVVGSQVEQHLDVPLGRLGDEPVQVFQGAELGMDAAKVADVITPVVIG